MKQFEMVRVKKPKSSVFDLSHERKLTANFGYLYPTFVQEVLPGDKFRVRMESMLRAMAMIAPMMHRVNVYQHFFFVPYRIIWDDWEEFITGGKMGTSAPVYPQFEGENTDYLTYFPNGSLGDHLGLPTDQVPDNTDPAPNISQLPFRAYAQIWNDYYRDETLQDELDFPKESGVIGYDEYTDLVTLQRRCWEKDYFTSCLPFAQRGDAVTLPLGDKALLKGQPYFWDEATEQAVIDTTKTLDAVDGEFGSSFGDTPLQFNYSPDDAAYADLSEATAATVSEVRRAFAIQRWMEKMARGGYRYIEQMMSVFGVKSKDSRLQRAEFLGGGKLPIQISEVLQTSESATTPQGNLAGHGFSSGQNAGFQRYFTEHGIVIGLLSIMPRTGYQNGLPKLFNKSDKYDYYWPELAHIGEQPVLNKEIYMSGDLEENEGTFGYQPRYSEYRYMFDSVHGAMKTSLNFWHLGRIFGGTPSLNDQFVTCDPSDRVFAVEEEDHFVIQLYFNFQAIRPVSKFGDPI